MWRILALTFVVAYVLSAVISMYLKVKLYPSIIERVRVPEFRRLAAMYTLTDLWSRAARVNGVCTMPAFGTLLGLHRQQELLCYDYDVDFITTASKGEIWAALRSFDRAVYRVSYDRLTRRFLVDDIATGIGLDIILYSYTDTHTLSRAAYRNIWPVKELLGVFFAMSGNAAVANSILCITELKLTQPLRTVDFVSGAPFKVPLLQLTMPSETNTEQWLASIYGADWRTPDSIGCNLKR